MTPLAFARAARLALARSHGWSDWAYLDADPDQDGPHLCYEHEDCREHAASALACLEWRGIRPEQVPCPSAPFRLREAPASWAEARAAWDRWTEAALADGRRPWNEIPPGPEHVTGTGRTAWSVDDDGTVTVRVTRPENPDGVSASREAAEKWGTTWRGSYDVLRAVVAPDGAVTIEVLGGAEDRHWQAFRDAVLDAACDAGGDSPELVKRLDELRETAEAEIAAAQEEAERLRLEDMVPQYAEGWL